MSKPLKDPVGAIARRIEKTGSDFSFGKPGPDDFVRDAVNVLGIEPDDERDDRLAQVIYDDCGEKMFTAQQMAAFLYAELTVTR